jgi:hypothetical protein
MEDLSVETKAKDGKCLLWSLGTQLEDKIQCNIVRQKALQNVCNDCERFRPFFACDMIQNNVQLGTNTWKDKTNVPDKYRNIWR